MAGKLVVYYSRAGSTAIAARKLAEQLDCDIAEIVSFKKFKGPFGWLAAGRSSMSGAEAGIIEPEDKPENYSLVILCSPIWASGIPSPVRTWLNRNKNKCEKIAYLLTYNGSGENRALVRFSALGGLAVNTLTLSVAERRTDEWLKKMESFAEEIKGIPE